MKTLAAILLSSTLLITSLRANHTATNPYRGDIEYLFELIENTNLTIDIRKQLYGLDLEKIKAEFLPLADSVQSDTECFLLVQRIFEQLHDAHMLTVFPAGTYWLEYDKVAHEHFNHIFSQYMADEYSSYHPSFKGIWIDKKFYLSEERIAKNSHKENRQELPIGSQILSIDGHPMDSYRYGPIANNILYPDQFFPEKNVTFLTPSGDTLSLNTPWFIQIPKNWTLDAHQPLVHFFESDSLLYIRLPRMSESLTAYYRKALKEVKKKPIDKIIIDVRGNYGGNVMGNERKDDNIWQELLALLLDTDLDIPVHLAMKKSDLSRKFLQTPNKQGTVWTDKKIEISDTALAFMPDIPLYLLSSKIHIAKKKNSLNYKGKIVVLFDENCYSVTLTMLSHLNKFPDKFITTGIQSGNFGGIGLPPFEFMLPHSKIMFQMANCVEINNPSSAADLVNNRLMIPVEPSVNDLHIRAIGIEHDTWYSKDFLEQHDRIFGIARKLFYQK